MARRNVRRRQPATVNRITAYLLHHLQSLVFSLGKIYQSPATTVMTVAVIGITLSLPGGFYLFTGALFVALVAYAAYRSTVRGTIPVEDTGAYVAVTPGYTSVAMEYAQEYAIEAEKEEESTESGR